MLPIFVRCYMNIEEVVQNGKVDFSGIPSNYYLLGLLSAFENAPLRMRSINFPILLVRGLLFLSTALTYPSIVTLSALMFMSIMFHSFLLSFHWHHKPQQAHDLSASDQ